jgi:hypothetical protein
VTAARGVVLIVEGYVPLHKDDLHVLLWQTRVLPPQNAGGSGM